MRPFFLAAADGAQLFAVHWPAAGTALRRAVLILPPLAEEMNKCRHMLAAQARALAAHGLDVLSVDLFGTGDSEADFFEARWSRWLQDLQQARAWLMTECAATGVHLLAARSGALFVPALLAADSVATRVMLWQPVLKGSDVWRQLLRMRQMADSTRGKGSSAEELEQLLAEASGVEIGGYIFHPELVAELKTAQLEEQSLQRASAVLWAEVSAADPPALSTGATRTCKQWTQAGIRLETAAVHGEPFWSTPEIGWARGLLEPTCNFALAS